MLNEKMPALTKSQREKVKEKKYFGDKSYKKGKKKWKRYISLSQMYKSFAVTSKPVVHVFDYPYTTC